MTYFENFISSSPAKTPPGTLVTLKNGTVVETKSAPAGFDLLRYAMFVYDNARYGFEVSHRGDALVVKVEDDDREVVSLELIYDEV